MNALPHIDVHTYPVHASPAAIWSALLRVLMRTMGQSARFARALGCDPVEASATFTGAPGETVPGFRVIEAVPGQRLALRGRHRFSDYALTFVIEGGQLRAESDAAFPGVLGQLYRTAVIGTGAHRIVTRGLLRQVARTAAATQGASSHAV